MVMWYPFRRKQKENGRAGLRAALLAAILTAGGGLAVTAAAAQVAAGPAANSEQALRERIKEFYGLLQLRQTARAEAYATKDSRERLAAQAGNPFLSFNLVSAEVNPDGRTATAVIDLMVTAPFMATPFPLQRNTNWVLEEGEWRIVVPEPAPTTLDRMLGITSNQTPPPEELQFKGHRYNLGLLKYGEVKTARFPFTNGSDHVVTIKMAATGCPCLQLKTTIMEYKPGESGELVIEFNSTGYPGEYVQTVVVKTSPGDIRSNLTIVARVLPPASAVSEPPSAPAR